MTVTSISQFKTAVKSDTVSIRLEGDALSYYRYIMSGHFDAIKEGVSRGTPFGIFTTAVGAIVGGPIGAAIGAGIGAASMKRDISDEKDFDKSFFKQNYHEEFDEAKSFIYSYVRNVYNVTSRGNSYLELMHK